VWKGRGGFIRGAGNLCLHRRRQRRIIHQCSIQFCRWQSENKLSLEGEREGFWLEP
jgi:hypothetical protein